MKDKNGSSHVVCKLLVVLNRPLRELGLMVCWRIIAAITILKNGQKEYTERHMNFGFYQI